MAKSRVEVYKDYEGTWTVFNRENGESASIVTIGEYSLLPTKTKYRVDFQGKTVDSMLTSWQKAKSIAIKCVRGNNNV